MLRVRLSRKGKKKSPFYRIVIIDKRNKRDGAPVEEVGTYNPFTKELKADKEKIQDWIKKGAIPTATITSLLKR
ncbi:MAG: 30S ribosomal protein S16 [Candidatus Melainabacteria bacterium]|nr:30S ribosomal protein S16 [Candidatus Melainabacteria bacterium]